MTGVGAIPAAGGEPPPAPDRDAGSPGGQQRSLRPASQARLASTRFGAVRWVAETGSTNRDALVAARHGDPEGLVVVADHQTAGRGRRDRRWEAAPGAALLASVLLRPPAAVAPLVTLAVGVAAVDAVRTVASVEARLKWPNDLVVPVAGDAGAEGPIDRRLAGDGPVDHKLAGILAEADWPAGSGAADGWREPTAQERLAVVVGVGLNMGPLPRGDHELAARAVSLQELASDPVDREDLLVALLENLEHRYADLRGEGPAELLDAWRERSATLGQRVRVDLGDRDVEGVAEDITDTGKLVVATSERQREVLAVGDVVHLRRQ